MGILCNRWRISTKEAKILNEVGIGSVHLLPWSSTSLPVSYAAQVTMLTAPTTVVTRPVAMFLILLQLCRCTQSWSAAHCVAALFPLGNDTNHFCFLTDGAVSSASLRPAKNEVSLGPVPFWHIENYLWRVVTARALTERECVKTSACVRMDSTPYFARNAACLTS